MISDIRSTHNTSSGKQGNTSATPVSQSGTVAKLGSEIKLVENLSLIKLNSSENLIHQGRPVQLLHASTANQSFSLLQSGSPIDLDNLASVKLLKHNNSSASIEVSYGHQTKPQGANVQNTLQSPNLLNTVKIDSLVLASRVVNLTVTSATTSSQITMVSDGQSEFPIMTDAKLKAGQVIRVMIDANNHLQVLPSKLDTTPPSISLDALRQSLPKQLSLNDMTTVIKQLQSIALSSPSTLPLQTQQALQQLIQNLPNLATLTGSPEAMKQAIQASGIFSESLLVAEKPALTADLKLNLSRVRDAQEQAGMLRIGNTSTEQIANAIERITTAQLRHFSDQNSAAAPSYPLHIELPIKNGNTLHMMHVEINQDASSEGDEKRERRWLVKLQFNFEETGRFDARVSIQANKVGILFAAEDMETVQKLYKTIPDLKQQLEKKDIEVERLDAFQAKLTKEEAKPVRSQSLIDVRT